MIAANHTQPDFARGIVCLAALVVTGISLLSERPLGVLGEARPRAPTGCRPIGMMLMWTCETAGLRPAFVRLG